MSTRVQKIILSALLAGCVSIASDAAITSNQTGNNNGFYYSLWHSTGSVSMTLGSAGNYALSWSSIGDVTAGKGWNPGGSRTVGYNCGVFNGGKVLAVYGWTTSPLIEYYIVEKGSVSGTSVGSVSSDGHTYNVAKHQQIQQPSIQGTQTFWQYISNWGGSGSGNHSVTTGNHFNYWKSHIGSMGSFNYMILVTEAWGGGSGNSNATVW